MDIAAMARTAGLTVLLDGRIGRETYESVSGSLEALRRFGDAYRAACDAAPDCRADCSEAVPE
ncbi:hypothetical protein [Paraburkholderia sediminicola]|uniref:hypothetical protein n=1 Tax=Paraburkholderia sediminicola TaxID=458836 RepID=UPI0038BA3272